MNFFHTADIHFGVENYGKIDAQTGIHTRLSDFAHNLECVVNHAIEQNIDFFLFCGDAYKTAQPTPTQQKLLAQQMLRLQKANIPVVIIVGNHDHPLSFGKAHALDIFDYLPVDGFYVFSKPDLITIKTKQGPIQIIGIPWPSRNHVVTNSAHRFKSHNEIATYISEKVGEIIQGLAQQCDPNVPTILAGHLTVSSGVFSGSEKCAVYGTDPVFLPSQLALEQFDYVALGHLHAHQNLNPNGKPALVYAGSIERIDFGERKEQKGYCNVTITQKKNGTRECHYEFITLATRTMLQIEVFLESTADQTTQILQELKKYDLRNAIVKIVYYIPDGKQDHVNLTSIHEACNQAIHIVGVFPVHKPVLRERRAALKVDMDFATLLNRYFDSKEQFQNRKNILIDKAWALKQQLEQNQQESE